MKKTFEEPSLTVITLATEGIMTETIIDWNNMVMVDFSLPT